MADSRPHILVVHPIIKEVSIMLDTISLLLTIIGGINWLLVGVFQFDLVAWIFGGQGAIISRIIYTVIGAAALWCITLLFRPRENGMR